MTEIICQLLFLYLLVIFVRVVLSWFPLNPNGSMATVAGFLNMVTDPVMNPVRRILPTARFGGMALDFSPIIVIFGIQILRNIIC
ncbi:MAG: YggT family protein [Acidimicrobiaceae bacterium]|nr:YggT family protein [Acidimicrobiaceae bacterium]MCY4175747.1 YggT family protein [Acidimicrobiaceae bacterium]MCY4279923.1 YggT family protein [Acidimicrobiaceae bacterium]MCY4294565.1 YggT family protein [Acidimicrobiaceae bacterium]